MEIGINKVIETIEKKLTKKDTIIDKKVLKISIFLLIIDLVLIFFINKIYNMQKEIIFAETLEIEIPIISNLKI